ncbi:hypothetical protein AOA14_01520 [Sphingopyxis terrae subsp. terrae NBRC 15098]|uniref:OmpA family protein n=2 Tax=Sphingopyxis TaxID=165697 RepID=A0A142VU05_9SPHN|nr:hypothetical protein [Sphingopyxis terrae]AMU93278.1 hypothetical protein AOA14_01520 [Sphingopyxis terrae subsp. terrae NBRC 15098]
MVRLLLVMTSALSIAAATLSLQSCGASDVEAAPPAGPLNNVVTLPDGSTLAAAKGSLSRNIAEWLASRDGQKGEFAFGGFAEDRPILTRAGIGQAADLSNILRAAPAASMEIAGDAGQARALAHMLGDRGIAPDRMKVVPAAGLGSVWLTIDRGSTASLITAKS